MCWIPVILIVWLSRYPLWELLFWIPVILIVWLSRYPLWELLCWIPVILIVWLFRYPQWELLCWIPVILIVWLSRYPQWELLNLMENLLISLLSVFWLAVYGISNRQITRYRIKINLICRLTKSRSSINIDINNAAKIFCYSRQCNTFKTVSLGKAMYNLLLMHSVSLLNIRLSKYVKKMSSSWNILRHSLNLS